MDKIYNLSFKKNDVEKLLLNLDQNPYSQKNKDFRYTLSLIYELIEEEFADTFDTKMIRKLQKLLDLIVEIYYNVIRIVLRVSKKQYF